MTESNKLSSLVSTRISEYTEHSFFVERMEEGASTFCSENSRLCPVKFNLNNWVHTNFEQYQMYSREEILAYKLITSADVMFPIKVNFNLDRGTLTYQAYGSKESVDLFEAWMNTQGFRDKDIEIKWAFGPDYQHMELFNMPLLCPDPIAHAYPWLGTSVAEFTQEFINSRESILVLMGQPGTGKTTFIKEMIKETGNNAMVTYDTNLLFTDGFFAAFMSSRDCDVLILEDADTIMGSRKDGNTMMHRFLNASDGLISMKGKKIIFTTNIPNIGDIDDALIRPGRCFDILNFRNLTKLEAQVVVDEFYTGEKPVLDKDKYSLAEVTNLGRNRGKSRNKTGFV